MTFKCLNVSSKTADAIVIEDADQVGGCVYAEQTNLMGCNGSKNMVIDGGEHSDITWLGCYLGIETGTSPVLIDVKGGKVLASGGKTEGQISFLMGYLWGLGNTFNLTNGARLLAGGYRNEVSTVTSNFMHLTHSSGDFTWVASDAGSDQFSASPFLLDGYNANFCNIAYYVNGIVLAKSKPVYALKGDCANSPLKMSMDSGILLPSHTAGGRNDGVGKTT